MSIDLANCTDTLTLSYLYNPSLAEGHSLEAWGQRLKFPKIEFNDWSKYSEEMESYCQGDVELTSRVYKALSEKMKRIGYSNLSCEIEHKIKIIIDEQINNGCWFDSERAKSFCNFLRREQSRLSKEIQQLFPPRLEKVAEYKFRRTKDGSPFAQYEKHRIKYPRIVSVERDGEECYECWDYVEFNIGSPKQRIDRLLELGWEPVNFTTKGNPKVDEDALIAFADKTGREEIRAIAEYLVVTSRLTTVGGNESTGSLGWLGNVAEDGRIHGDVFPCGAQSRRMRHNNPNQANAPSAKKSKYGKECRSFWGVKPNSGLCLVGYDAKGLETECLKHWLNNPEANRILAGDIHTANAIDLTKLIGREIDREWGAKTSWYAWAYGCYPPKLMQILKCERKHAEYIWEELFPNRIPGLKKLLNETKWEWKKNGGRIRCIDGGYVICPSESATLNYLIQPTGSVVMKMASIIIKEESSVRGIWNKKVLDIHDEGQHEALEKEIYKGKLINKKGLEEEVFRHPFGDLAVWSIREAGKRLNMNVELDGDYAVGYNWSQTH